MLHLRVICPPDRLVALIVALLAGAAGMLSLTSAKSAALVGVFISVTTVPAAGYSVVAALLQEWAQAVRAATQLVVNLAGIVLAGVTVLLLRGAPVRAPDRVPARDLS